MWDHQVKFFIDRILRSYDDPEFIEGKSINWVTDVLPTYPIPSLNTPLFYRQKEIS